jgi:hypothetical protein
MNKVIVSLSDKGGWTWAAVFLHLYAHSLNDTRSLFLIDLTPICQELRQRSDQLICFEFFFCYYFEDDFG